MAWKLLTLTAMEHREARFETGSATSISWRGRKLDTLDRQELLQAIGHLVSQDWHSVENTARATSRSFFMGLVTGLCASTALSLLALLTQA